MTWSGRKPYECLLFYRTKEKSDERGSFKYRHEGRAGNPSSIYPKDFFSSKGVRVPLGTTEKILAHDARTLDEIRKLAKEQGIQRGVYDLRRNYGGPGPVESRFRKLQLKQAKGSMKMGTKILLRGFEV